MEFWQKPAPRISREKYKLQEEQWKIQKARINRRGGDGTPTPDAIVRTSRPRLVRPSE